MAKNGSTTAQPKRATNKRKQTEEAREGGSAKKRQVLASEPAKQEPKAKSSKRGKVKTALNSAPTEPLDVYVFGSGDSGELGLGTKNAIEAKTPRLNSNLSNVVQISLGGMHGIALTRDNKILTWGVNDQGALGRDTKWEGRMTEIDAESADDNEDDLNPNEATPAPIPSSKFPPGTTFTQVAAGDSTSFVLTEEGFVYGCGIFRNSKGSFAFNLAEGNEIDDQPQRDPKLIPGLKDIKQITVGGDHALALDKKGAVFAWGSGEQSQLGRRLLERHQGNSLKPTPVALPKTIVSIHAAANHSFAIDKNGYLYAWGLNNFGQCGIKQKVGNVDAVVTKPEKVPNLDRRIKMVAGGNHHSIAVTNEGDCMVWGRLDGSQMGIKLKSLPLQDEGRVLKTETGRPCVLVQPTKVPNIPKVNYVAAGSDHCIAITENGSAYSWGFNTSYQCGQGPEKAEENEDDSDDDDGIDEVQEAAEISSLSIKDKALMWAGAGGQFSAVAGKAQN